MEIDGAANGEIILVAEDKIKTLCGDTINGILPCAPIVHRSYIHDIGDPNFAEDAKVFTDGLLKGGENRALGWREQLRVSDIRKLVGTLGLMMREFLELFEERHHDNNQKPAVDLGLGEKGRHKQ